MPISDKIIKLLRRILYLIHRTVKWLFEGQLKGSRYSEKSLESVLKQSVIKAGIKAGYVALVAAQLCYPFAGIGNRFKVYTGVIRTQQFQNNRNIYMYVSTKSLQNIKSPYEDLF